MISVVVATQLLIACISEKNEIQSAISASNFEIYSFTFSSPNLKQPYILGEDSGQAKSYMQSLRSAGKTLSFIIAESTTTENWETGFNENICRRNEIICKDFRFSMNDNASQLKTKISSNRILKPGFKYYSIGSCNDSAAIRRIHDGTKQNEIIGECISFYGIRCDKLMAKCMISTAISYNSKQTLFLKSFFYKSKGHWRDAEDMRWGNTD